MKIDIPPNLPAKIFIKERRRPAGELLSPNGSLRKANLSPDWGAVNVV